MKPRNPSLIGIVARRIVAFSLIAMAISEKAMMRRATMPISDGLRGFMRRA